jgi:hypothetical protein
MEKAQEYVVKATWSALKGFILVSGGEAGVVDGGQIAVVVLGY